VCRLVGHIDPQQVVQHLDSLAVAALRAQQAGQSASDITGLSAQPPTRGVNRRADPIL
jgi:hypothetical protein